jgi:hypothetical protein
VATGWKVLPWPLRSIEGSRARESDGVGGSGPDRTSPGKVSPRAALEWLVWSGGAGDGRTRGERQTGGIGELAARRADQA